MYCRSTHTPEVFSTLEAPTSSISPSTSFSASAAQTEISEIKRTDNKKNARAPGDLFIRPPFQHFGCQICGQGSGSNHRWTIWFTCKEGVPCVDFALPHSTSN